MKTELKLDGTLYISPESELEAYALNKWADENVSADATSNIIIHSHTPTEELKQNVSPIDDGWCMCKEVDIVYRDWFSTCGACGGRDAYGTSNKRPVDKRKASLLPKAKE